MFREHEAFSGHTTKPWPDLWLVRFDDFFVERGEERANKLTECGSWLVAVEELFAALQYEQLFQPLVHLLLVFHDDAEGVVLAVQADDVLVLGHVHPAVDVEAGTQSDAAFLVGDSVVGALGHQRPEFLFVVEVLETRSAGLAGRVVEYDEIFLFLAALLVQLVKCALQKWLLAVG